MDTEDRKSIQCMTATKKRALLVALREMAWDLKRAGVREMHPEWGVQKIEAEVRKIFLHATT